MASPAFMDLEKAYTTEWPCAKCQRTMEKGKNVFEQGTACVRLAGKVGSCCNVTNGLKQGCGVSPRILKFYMV